MPVTNAHTLYAVNIDPTTAADAVFIKQISNFMIDPAIAEVLLGADGDVDPTFVATMGQAPRAQFTTTMLATLLAEATNGFLINGIKIDSDVDNAGAEMFFQKMAEGGARTAGANHYKLTVNEGLLIARRIAASQGGIATADLELHIGYDGTNAAIVVAASQSLEGTSGVSELFTLGPVKLNGTLLDAVQSVVIDTGIQVVAVAADGDVFPTFIGIQARQPSVVIQTLDVSVISTYGISGTAQSASDSLIYLRKMAPGASRVADATAEHISISVDEGQIRVGAIQGAHGAVLGAQVTLRPTYDGSVGIFVVNPATAIT